MTVKCYDETPSVKLDGPSPLEGLVVLGSDGYVCNDGFNARAADLVCWELGFPAAEKYSAQTLPSTATRRETQRVSCPPQASNRFHRLSDCSMATTECSSNKGVRLKCREPGFLGCYEGNQQAFPLLFELGFDVHSDEECISICRRGLRHNEIALIHRGTCVCSRSKSYADVLSDRSYSHNWTCPSQGEVGSGHFVYYLYNISVGFCNLPGHVMNGHWNSNITRYGSNITLTCDKGYAINGSATFQCVELPGWSTYHPVWNTSVRSCQPVENETNDTEWYSTNFSTSTTQTAINTFNSGGSTQEQTTERGTSMSYSHKGRYVQDTTARETTSSLSNGQSTQELMTFHDTAIASSDSPVPGSEFITYILGALLGVALLVLVTVSMACCRYQQKRRRGTSRLSNRASDYPGDGQLQMHAVNTSIRNQRTTNIVPSSGIIAGTEALPLPSHEENIFGDASLEQEDSYHIYQDTAEVDREVPPPAGMTSMTAENNLAWHEYHSLQETSLQQAANSYEDCVYQDVDLDNRTGGMTKDDFNSSAKACLFDDSCYNSLNFGERPDRVFAQIGNTCLDSEYDSIDHISQYDVAPIQDPVFSASSSTSRKDDNMACFIPAKSEPSDDLLEIKVNCENSHDFDSDEYSRIREDDNHDTKNLVCFYKEPKPCEELYATVNKTAKTSSSASPPCEELYAKVDKRRGEHTDVKQTSQEKLYMNVTNIM
ncbi:uncharacterized protein [Diadema antillarum]|uniref:uncharacterized protein n=1 Tax=Diadema antillarum TaxID=105358 RepID=UPI003A8B526A